MKVRRIVGTPTKAKTTRPEQATSPSMLDFFTSAKSTQLTSAAQETNCVHTKPSSKFVSTRPNEYEDPFVSQEMLPEKHSRPSTSSSADLVKHLTKKSSSGHSKDDRSVQPATLSASISDPAGGDISGTLLVTAPDEREHKPDMLQKQGRQPPPLVEDKTDRASSRVVPDSSAHADTLSNVTQRTPKRRPKKDQAAVDSRASSPSPIRPRRPIERFFKPYMKSKVQEASLAAEISVTESQALIVVPPELTTGLSTTFSTPPHLHAVPRSSLPGTWKENICDSAPNSQTMTARSSRPPRVSVVDLTAD